MRIKKTKRIRIMKIFDTHAHYDDEQFKQDVNTLLDYMHHNGVQYIVNIACSMESSREIIKFIEDYDFIYGTVGVHPDAVSGLQKNDMEELAKYAKNEKIRAIGEIGLDYHYENVDKLLQKKWFIEQLALAKNQNLPVVIHSRDAAKDTLDIVKSEHAKTTGGVIHCFCYGVDLVKEYLNMDYYIGVGGVVTFKNGKKLKEVVTYTPLDRILLETDAPYLAPVPFRGKRNCSSYLTYVAEEIARLKNITVEEVYEVTYQNAKNLYRVLNS